jgi:aspartate carbamoyltransferase catalytic subunit
MPEPEEFPGCVRFAALEEGLTGVDVVMMLRVQRERIAQTEVPDGDEYFARYGLNAARLRRRWPTAHSR